MRDKVIFFLRLLYNGIVKCLVALIRIYQYIVSPFLGRRCRFYPSCSCYAVECLNKYYLPKACFKIIVRLLKCHPFHPGGVDLP